MVFDIKIANKQLIMSVFIREIRLFKIYCEKWFMLFMVSVERSEFDLAPKGTTTLVYVNANSLLNLLKSPT